MHTEQVKIYVRLTVEIKGNSVNTDGKNFLNQPFKNDIRTYENRKIATGQGDDYTTGFLLDILI